MSKKCYFCNTMFDDSDEMIHKINGITYCEKCSNVFAFANKISEYYISVNEKIDNDSFFDEINKTLIYSSNGFQMHDCLYKKKIVSKTTDKEIIKLIEKIESVRRFLCIEVGGYFKILDSIYEDRNIFWDETGDLLRYVHNASFENIVLKLKELLNPDCKYSIPKIMKTLDGNKENYSKKIKMYCILDDKKGFTKELKYDTYSIDAFIIDVNDLLNNSKKIIDDARLLRNKYLAHIEDIDWNKYKIELSFVNLKRLYKTIETIYGFSIMVLSPDRLAENIFDDNFRFNHLDAIVEEYKKNKLSRKI